MVIMGTKIITTIIINQVNVFPLRRWEDKLVLPQGIIMDISQSHLRVTQRNVPGQPRDPILQEVTTAV
jgi:hypothetical protein